MRYRALLAVSDTLPYERPWKEPKNAITYCRPVAYRASLMPASTASVPEFVRKLLAGFDMPAIRSSCSQTSE